MARKPKPPEKRIVNERIKESWLDLEVDVDSAIATLTKAKADFMPRYDRLFLENEQDCSCYGRDCGCKSYLRLYGSRMETDAEFDKRVSLETEQEAVRTAQRRAQFEALAKEFGKS